MEILVDYNNVLERDRRRGPRFVLDKILNALAPTYLASESRVSFRLYDGWYERDRLTHEAQQIAVELTNAYPTTHAFSTGPEIRKVIVNAGCAYSIKLAPRRNLWNTYRVRQGPGPIKCRHPSTLGCTSGSCKLKPVFDLMNSGGCPDAKCAIRIEDLLYRSEQKLVDSMLATDIFFFALEKPTQLAVVTSDDDLWPPILAATQIGVKIIHVHTQSARSTSSDYCQGLGGRYVQLSL